MARPSKNLDMTLIKVAKAMMMKGGMSDISIRKVCQKANVNQGMFTYLFGTRKKFLKKLHDDLYEDFFASLQRAAQEGSTPIERLSNTILEMTRTCRERHTMTVALIRDHINGEMERICGKPDFVPKDVLLVIKLIEDCQEAGDITRKISSWQIFVTLVPPIVIPVLTGAHLQEICGTHAPKLKQIDLTSEAACKERLGIILRGLKP
jgi:AcrR family transcriptional regulator